MYKGHNPLGEKGEVKACEYLKNQGLKLIKQNYSCKLGEIDLIFKEKELLVFVEVKTRSSEKFGLPREAVNAHKQNKIHQVATMFMLEQKCYPCACRFDVVEVLGDNVTHIKNAF